MSYVGTLVENSQCVIELHKTMSKPMVEYWFHNTNGQLEVREPKLEMYLPRRGNIQYSTTAFNWSDWTDHPFQYWYFGKAHSEQYRRDWEAYDKNREDSSRWENIAEQLLREHHVSRAEHVVESRERPPRGLVAPKEAKRARIAEESEKDQETEKEEDVYPPHFLNGYWYLGFTA